MTVPAVADLIRQERRPRTNARKRTGRAGQRHRRRRNIARLSSGTTARARLRRLAREPDALKLRIAAEDVGVDLRIPSAQLGELKLGVRAVDERTRVVLPARGGRCGQEEHSSDSRDHRAGSSEKQKHKQALEDR